MKRKFWISIAILLSGLVILLLPDNGNRVFSFNEDHGPSWQDLGGLVLIISGWIYWVINILQERKKIYRQLKLNGVLILVLLLIAGTIFIIGGLRNENNAMLYAGIGISVATYLLPVLIAFQSSTKVTTDNTKNTTNPK